MAKSAKKKGSPTGALSDDALFDCFAFEIYSTTTRCVPGEEVRRAGIDVRALAHHLRVAQFESHERTELEHELSQAFSLYKAGNYAGAEAKVVAVFRAAVASHRFDEMKAQEPANAAGGKVLRASRAGNEAKKIAAAEKYKVWQNKANELWAKYPNRTSAGVAVLMANEMTTDIGARKTLIDAIRRKIKKPS